MNGAITALRCYKLVHRIPGNALDVMIMLGEFAYARPVCDTENTRRVVCATGDHILARRAPGKVVDLVRSAACGYG